MDSNITSGYFILTENCNLRCTYCFEKNTRAINKYMSKETAFRGIDFLFQEAIKNQTNPINITWFGGEPALCPGLMSEMMDYAEQQAKEKEKEVTYHLITNGTIYNEQIEEFLEKWYATKGKNVTIQLSIDGIPAIQDKKRPCADSRRQSSILVKEAVAKYKQFFVAHEIPEDNLHIHACVSKDSLPFLYESYQYFTGELGIRNSKYSWVIEDAWEDTDLEIFSQQLGLITSKLCKITTNRKRFPFKHFYQCSGCSSGRKLVCFDTEGTIYPCHRFFFYDKEKRKEMELGSLYHETSLNEEKRKAFIEFRDESVTNLPCQICIAVNHEYTGRLDRMPNDFSVKFMSIINQYFAHFSDVCEKRLMVEAIKKLESRVTNLEEENQELRERIEGKADLAHT